MHAFARKTLPVVVISLLPHGLALADATQDPGYCTTVACRVDEQCATHACKIAKSSGSLVIDNQALTYVSKARHWPRTHNGTAVSSDHAWQVCFRLDPKPTR
jgi:TonB family protein